MTLDQYFAANPALFIGIVSVFGLLIGSFLNVVIYRVPEILKRGWTKECLEFFYETYNTEKRSNNNTEQEAEEYEDIQVKCNKCSQTSTAIDLFNIPISFFKEKFNLIKPDSTCPKCGHKIRAYENIPVISYLFLRGKCSSCKSKISVRYPIIELFTAVLSAIVAYKFEATWLTAVFLILTYCLISLSFIDIDTQLLPDIIVIPLLWIGLLCSLFEWFPISPRDSIIGAASGYLSLWIFNYLFMLLRKKQGMGNGDFKLFAVFGAWLGWKALPGIILTSSFVGAVIGITIIIVKQKDKDLRIPFGPYLAAAGFIFAIWGDKISLFYLNTAGLS